MGCDGLWVQYIHFAMGWVGLGQSFGELDWVGLKKLDPRTTLGCFCLAGTQLSVAIFASK